jgi:Microcystin-dependent protein
MADPFLGQIEVFGFSFAPKSWAPCNGQLLGISQNQALFALLGTTYGGNGVTTFGLPDLRGRVPVGQGTDFQRVNWTRGQTGGTETVALTVAQIPAHTHALRAAGDPGTGSNTNQPGPTVGLGVTNGVTSDSKPFTMPAYVEDAAPAAVLGASALSQVGGQPHENRMPLLALTICICLAGIFPSRN